MAVANDSLGRWPPDRGVSSWPKDVRGSSYRRAADRSPPTVSVNQLLTALQLQSEPRQGLGETGSRRGADGEETGTLKAALKEARGQLLYSPCSGSRLPCCQGGRVVVACSAPRNDKTISQNGRPCELKRDKARFSPCPFRRMVPNSPTSDLVRTRRPGGGTSPGSSGSGPVDQHAPKSNQQATLLFIRLTWCVRWEGRGELLRTQ